MLARWRKLTGRRCERALAAVQRRPLPQPRRGRNDLPGGTLASQNHRTPFGSPKRLRPPARIVWANRPSFLLKLNGLDDDLGESPKKWLLFRWLRRPQR